MFRRIFVMGTIFSVMTGFADKTVALKPVPNLVGTYHCNGYDNLSGNFQGTMILSLDANGSVPGQGYEAYNYKESTVDGERYVGTILENGDVLSEYFENVQPDEYDDTGIGNMTLTADKNANGISQLVLHELYYEPKYAKGDTGTETCIKN